MGIIFDSFQLVISVSGIELTHCLFTFFIHMRCLIVSETRTEIETKRAIRKRIHALSI